MLTGGRSSSSIAEVVGAVVVLYGQYLSADVIGARERESSPVEDRVPSAWREKCVGYVDVQ